MVGSMGLGNKSMVTTRVTVRMEVGVLTIQEEMKVGRGAPVSPSPPPC